MTYGQLKVYTSSILKAKRDVAMTDDNAVILALLEEAMTNIANKYKVLKLITKSANFRLLRSLGDGYYIRTPKIPRDDTDKLDMDSELHIALANYIAATLASDAKNSDAFRKTANKIVKDYAFKIYNTPKPEIGEFA